MLHSLIYVHGKQEERADCSVARWAKSETTAFLNSFPKTIRTCKKVPSGQVTFHSYLRHRERVRQVVRQLIKESKLRFQRLAQGNFFVPWQINSHSKRNFHQIQDKRSNILRTKLTRQRTNINEQS